MCVCFVYVLACVLFVRVWWMFDVRFVGQWLKKGSRWKISQKWQSMLQAESVSHQSLDIITCKPPDM